MKTIVLFVGLIVLFSSVGCAFAQPTKEKKNGIYIYGRNGYRGRLSTPYYTDLFLLKKDVIGIVYERTFFKNFQISAAYNELNGLRTWNRTWLPRLRTYGDALNAYNFDWVPNKPMMNILEKSGDVTLEYCFKKIKRLRIKVGGGVSYCHMALEVYDSFSIYPGYNDFLIFSHASEANYWGFVGSLRCHYSFFKERFLVGYSIVNRTYPNSLYRNRYEFGLYIGTKF